MGNRAAKENHFRLVRAAEEVSSKPSASVTEVEEAIAQCRNAIELCPSYPYSYLILSKLLYQGGHFADAAEAARQCTEAMPELYAAYFLWADSLEARDEFEAAIGVRSRVPKHLRADLQRAHERRMAGRRPRSAQQLEVEGGGPRSRRNLAAESLLRRHPFVVPHVLREDGTGSANGADGLSQDDVDSATTPVDASRSARCVELAPISTHVSSSLPPAPAELLENDACPSVDVEAEDEIWKDREEDFRKALRRDSNLRRWRGGQRRTIPRTAVERTRVRQITEHREKHTRLMARLNGVSL